MASVPEGLRKLVRERFPGCEIVEAEALGPDAGRGATEKVEGYGAPLRLRLLGPEGARTLVFRTVTPNAFGHDRRSDRAGQLLLAFDTFGLVPDHVAALDVGAVLAGGRLESLRESGEFWLLTTFAEGRLYAEDLRRVAAEGAAPRDARRCEALAQWLARLHAERIDDADGYRRAVRDLLGHGEGIFGMVDGYPGGAPGAPPERLRRIEERCLRWRWRLRGRERRLARIHGDFHPFNLLFGEGERFTLVDASRGCRGDPADDVTAMAVNYVFFALDRPGAWVGGLGGLWRRFLDAYGAESGDREVLDVAPPWLAWRCLVLASPRFYPRLSAGGRDRLLRLAERALDAGRLELAMAAEVFG